jgi:hypothetical protein
MMLRRIRDWLRPAALSARPANAGAHATAASDGFTSGPIWFRRVSLFEEEAHPDGERQTLVEVWGRSEDLDARVLQEAQAIVDDLKEHVRRGREFLLNETDGSYDGEFWATAHCAKISISTDDPRTKVLR